MEIKHSILVITYKQEDLIGACLDSILSQSVKPWEVIIIDDCSPDNTWEVVQKYVKKYPEIIKAHRNEFNLGVCANQNKIKQMPTGDFVNCVSGDDLLPDGILETYNNIIDQQEIDINSSFIIYSNAYVINQDGSITLKDNTPHWNRDLFELIALHCFWGWDTGMSRKLYSQIPDIREDIGYQSDLLWHFNKAYFAENHYFTDAVGYMYRMGCGVTAATTLEKHLISKRMVYQEIKKAFPERMNKTILDYFDFDIKFLEYSVYPSFKRYIAFIESYLKIKEFPKNNAFRRNYKLLLPIGFKKAIKRLLSK